MLDKLNIVKQRFDEVSDLIIQPDIIADQKRYVKLNKEYKDLKLLVDKREQYIAFTNNISDGSDAEMVEMAKMQLDEAKEGLPKLEEEIKFLLIPKDPEDEKDVVMEIRAGTGGDEASIFAGDLYRMYAKYCESKGWKTNIIDLNEGTSGGYKEIHFEVSGEDVYGTLKFEAGVHRVQRVPQTETQGRVHTSAATVMVIPEAEDFDVQIDPKDVRIDFFCVKKVPNNFFLADCFGDCFRRVSSFLSAIICCCLQERCCRSKANVTTNHNGEAAAKNDMFRHGGSVCYGRLDGD